VRTSPFIAKRHALARRWVSKHFTLFAFPKAFLSKPDVTIFLAVRTAAVPGARSAARATRCVDMSMQVIAFNSRVVIRSVDTH
jgi:hypothetical protein